MNMNTMYDTNRLPWIGNKNLTGNLKTHLWRSSCSSSWILIEKSTHFSGTCLKFMVIFLWLFVITFLRKRDTPNNKFLDVTNKETDKVMLPCCWSPPIMNLEQLIFTWKGRQLLLALFTSDNKRPSFCK